MSGLLPLPGCRIIVAGVSGSGKTTVASTLARMLGAPHIELDALHWQPGWVETPESRLRALVEQATRGASWVIDGNYTRLHDITLPRADTLVWLDYALPVVMAQLLARTVRRAWKKEELWNGNYESWRMSFLSRDSILLWALKTHSRRRREYAALLAEPAAAHLTVIHLRSRSQTRVWLQAAAAQTTTPPETA